MQFWFIFWFMLILTFLLNIKGGISIDDWCWFQYGCCEHQSSYWYLIWYNSKVSINLKSSVLNEFMIHSIIIVSCYCCLRYFRKHCFTSLILVKIQSIAEAFCSKISKWFWIQLRNQFWDSSTKILWFNNYDFKCAALMQMSVLYQTTLYLL